MKQARLHVFYSGLHTQVSHIYFYVYVVVQFYPWFKFCFPLFQTHYLTLPYPNTKGIKFKPRMQLNHNIYVWWCLQWHLQYKRQMCGHCLHCFCDHFSDEKCFGTINFNGKSILNRSLNQFGQVVSKSEEKSRWQFYASSGLCMFLRRMFRLGFLTSKPYSFPEIYLWIYVALSQIHN